MNVWRFTGLTRLIVLDWTPPTPLFITADQFNGGIAVEHEDEFWDAPRSGNLPGFPQQRKNGFILARRFLGQYLPGRLV
jgi:hypothetical protein